MIWALGQFGAQALAALLSFSLVARAVGPAAYADYVVGLAITALAQCFGLAVFREPVVQAQSIDNIQLASVAKVSVLWSLFLALITCAATWMWFSLQGGSKTVLYVVFLLTVRILLDGVTAVPLAGKARTLDLKLQSISSMLGSAVMVLVVALGIRLNLGVVGLALAQATGQLVQSAISLHFCRFTWLWRSAIDRQILAQLLPKSLSVVSWQIIDYVNGSLDRLFVSARMPPSNIGVYGFGKRLNDIVFETVGGGFGMVCLPIFSRANGDAHVLKVKFLSWIGYSAFFVLPLLGYLFLSARELVVTMFGPKWEGAVDIYRVFLVLGVLQALGVVQAALIRGMGQAGVWTRYLLTQAAGNVLVVVTFSTLSGFWLAVAIVVKTYLIWGYSVVSVCRLLELRAATYILSVLRPFASMAGSVFAAWWVCAVFAKISGVEFILVSIVVYVLLYLLISALINRQGTVAALNALRGKAS